MAKFLRIEKDGEGPYVRSVDHISPWDWVDSITRHNSPDHPGPTQSGMNRTESDVFGFKDWKQARAWFSDSERRKLKRLGFKWHWFSGTLTGQDAYQVMFRKDDYVSPVEDTEERSLGWDWGLDDD